MGHRRGRGGERLGAAQADRKLGDLQGVKESEGLALAAFQIKREGRSGAEAVALVNVVLARSGLEETKIANRLDFGVILEEGAHLGGILAGAAHPQLKRFEATEQHPRGVGVADSAHRVADHPYLVEQRLRSGQPASDEIRVTAGIFGQAIDRNVGALVDRPRPQRAEEGIVDRDRRARIGRESGRASRDHSLDIDQRIGRVGRAFEVDQRDIAHRLGAGQHVVDFVAGRARRKVEIFDPELGKDLGDDRLGRGIERTRMDDHVPGADEGQKQGGDRGHAARESEGFLGIFP